MIDLPKDWQEMVPGNVVLEVLAAADRAGRYLPVARGLTYAYLCDCVSDVDAIAEDGLRRGLGSVFRFRSQKWAVLARGTDRDVEWAFDTLTPRSRVSIVSPPWTQGLIASAVQNRRDWKRFAVKTLDSLLCMHIFFASAGERHAEQQALRRLLHWHNGYCNQRGLYETIRA